MKAVVILALATQASLALGACPFHNKGDRSLREVSIFDKDNDNYQELLAVEKQRIVREKLAGRPKSGDWCARALVYVIIRLFLYIRVLFNLYYLIYTF
jgi:hypothetical protein